MFLGVEVVVTEGAGGGDERVALGGEQRGLEFPGDDVGDVEELAVGCVVEADDEGVGGGLVVKAGGEGQGGPVGTLVPENTVGVVRDKR